MENQSFLKNESKTLQIPSIADLPTVGHTKYTTHLTFLGLHCFVSEIRIMKGLISQQSHENAKMPMCKVLTSVAGTHPGVVSFLPYSNDS